MAKQTSVDYELLFSNAQSIAATANTASTNEIDLGSTGMGEGVAIKGVINVTEITGTTSVKVCHKTSASVAATDNPVTLTTLSAVGQYHFTLPQSVSRYVKLFYTGVTSTTVTAWLTAETRQ